jgi:hypothetical protein
LDWKLALGNAIGYLMGQFADPDWDLITANNSESRMINKLPILGNFMFGISSMYGSFFFHHHRSFWSHFPIISTIIRLVFIFIVPFIFLDSWEINLIGDGWWKLWIGVWIGLSQSDAVHYALDKFYKD